MKRSKVSLPQVFHDKVESRFWLDFAEALKREPTNESVKEELAKVVGQLVKQKVSLPSI